MRRTVILAVIGLSFFATATLAQTNAYSSDNAAGSTTNHRARQHKLNPEKRARFHAAMCTNRYALAVGHMAYLEASLNLTSQQTGAFDSWKNLKIDQAKVQSQRCAEQGGAGQGTAGLPVERLARQGERLKSRLANLDAERPVFTAMYNTLTDDQKRMLSRGLAIIGAFWQGDHGGILVRRQIEADALE